MTRSIRKTKDATLDAIQREHVRIKLYISLGFDEHQAKQIARGIEEKLDFSVYAKKEYTWEQMNQIRLGIRAKINYTNYLNPAYPWHVMSYARELMMSNAHNDFVNMVLNPTLSKEESKMIFVMSKDKKFSDDQKKANICLYLLEKQ